jgi:hypothetical protein
MNKKYQVFISSTYMDLKDERQQVFQTLMEMDCIPSGMELFPASDEEQLVFIKRVIDECDYYLLIIGGRYGSTAEDGLSYTEKEYQYAVDSGKYVIAFIHGDPGSIPAKLSDSHPGSIEKLNAFRGKVKTGRLVKFYSGIEDLVGKVSVSMNNAIRYHPASGWIRGDQVVDPKVLVELEELRRENAMLKSKGINRPKSLDVDVASHDVELELSGWSRDDDGPRRSWRSKKTYLEWLCYIGPHLLCPRFEEEITSYIGDLEQPSVYAGVDDQRFQDLKVQFYAYDWIKFDVIEDERSKAKLRWSLTEKAAQMLILYRARRANE